MVQTSGRRVAKNAAANLAARGWGIVSNYLFIPAYIAQLGMESYSIISFSLVVLSFVAVMDAGLTATITREFASKNRDSAGKVRVFRTLETCYLLLCAAIMAMFITFAGKLATGWLNLGTVEPGVAAAYLRLFGVGCALQLLAQFYSGGLFGFERQVAANAYQVTWSAARNGLVILVMHFRPSLTLFAAWQLCVTVCYAVLLRRRLLAELGARSQGQMSASPAIDREVLSVVWRFAGGMFAVALLASLNSQLDKLMLSKLLSISDLGYYTLASAPSQALLTMMSALGVASLPRFTHHYSLGEFVPAVALYGRILAFAAVLSASVGVMVALNAELLVWAWTGSHDIAGKAAQYVPLLVSGSALLALQVIPFSVAVANGHTRTNRWLGAASLLLTGPGYYVAIRNMGAFGAALVWMLFNAIATPALFIAVHRKFVASFLKSRHYPGLVGVPLLGSALTGVAYSLLPHRIETRPGALLWLFVGGALSLTVGFGLVVRAGGAGRVVADLSLRESP